MLVVGLKSAHDGAIAAVKDRALLLSLEGEKDSFPRHSVVTPTTLVRVGERLGELPDVVALDGWFKNAPLGDTRVGAGYYGTDSFEQRTMNFFGKRVTFFSSSHERSHILMAIGMASRDDAPLRAVLVWEGAIGSFYLVNDSCEITRELPVLDQPGTRYSSLFALADPTFPRHDYPRLEDSGKLMALAAYGDPRDADPQVAETVERILRLPEVWPFSKFEFANSPIHDAGVEADVTKVAAALLTERIFETFATAAQAQLPSGIPLHISGGCGLNCDWNTAWRDLGHFSSVFVPPCTNDSGSAIGVAIDALATLTGDPYIAWDVYSGLDFEWDCEPDTARWTAQPVRHEQLADVLAGGHIVAWVQGREEIGPRALGNRSLLAEPFQPRTRERLNKLKQRESYRPIAPCCRLEDAGEVFDRDFEDPYMLYFRMTRSGDLGAVTHVDGSARCQTVTAETNKPLYELLSAFQARASVGVLCNTSLNFKGFGFINRLSDLLKYCETGGVTNAVVGDTWFQGAQSWY
jgi:hydroxymethyl cephem carbamoyltransferase